MKNLMTRPSKKMASMQGLFESWGGRTNDLLPGSRRISKQRNSKALRSFGQAVLQEVLLDMEEDREEEIWRARMEEEFYRECEEEREREEEEMIRQREAKLRGASFLDDELDFGEDWY